MTTKIEVKSGFGTKRPSRIWTMGANKPRAVKLRKKRRSSEYRAGRVSTIR